MSDLEKRYIPTQDAEEKKEGDTTEHEYGELLAQVASEFEYGYAFMTPKFNEWQKRLKVYMNQTKKKSDVGSMLIFTIHQTLIAAMYNDKINVKFLPRGEGDVQSASNWESLAKFDYDLMEKPILDYEWIWDTTFFSYGLVLMHEWDDNDQCPVPVTMDVTNFIRDPNAISITGKRNGEGKTKFCGGFVYLTEYEVNENIKSGVFDLIEDCEEVESGTGLDNTVIEANMKLRQAAMGYSNIQTKNNAISGASKLYKFLRWFTFSEEGKPLMVYTTGDRQKIVGVKELMVDSKSFPIIDRKLHPMTNTWDGVSVSDACEDKQRAIAILENLMLELSKYAVYSRYLYDINKIPNKAELEEHKMNQYIGVKGDLSSAIMEIPKTHISTDISFTINTLQSEAEKATATPEIRQGVQAATARSATENAEISKNVDTRYGLNARVMTWSEKRFWNLWFKMYQKYFFSQAKEKIVRVLGEAGLEFRPMTVQNLKMSKDPDIQIESMAVSELERTVKLQAYSNMYKLAATDPTIDKRYIMSKIAQYSEFSAEEQAKIFPKTFDEYLQEAENKQLNAGQIVHINPEDDDYTHLRVLEKANQNKESKAHAKAHLEQLFFKKKNPQAQAQSASPVDPAQMMQQMGGSQPAPTTDYSQPNMLQTA